MFRRTDGEDGERRLRTHAGYADEQLEAIEFLLGGKAVEFKNAVANIQISVKAFCFTFLELTDGAVRRATGVAHAAAVNDREVRLDMRDRSFHIIEYRAFPLFRPFA